MMYVLFVLLFLATLISWGRVLFAWERYLDGSGWYLWSGLWMLIRSFITCAWTVGTVFLWRYIEAARIGEF